MFFKPKAHKRYISRAHEFLLGDLHFTQNTSNPDRDAVILFCGFSHFFIGYNIGRKQLRENDIAPLLVHLALTVRAHAPDHHLGDSYIEDTMHTSNECMGRADAHFIKWIPLYYAAFQDRLEIGETDFTAFLSADVMAVVQGQI